MIDLEFTVNCLEPLLALCNSTVCEVLRSCNELHSKEVAITLLRMYACNRFASGLWCWLILTVVHIRLCNFRSDMTEVVYLVAAYIKAM